MYEVVSASEEVLCVKGIITICLSFRNSYELGDCARNSRTLAALFLVCVWSYSELN